MFHWIKTRFINSLLKTDERTKLHLSQWKSQSKLGISAVYGGSKYAHFPVVLEILYFVIGFIFVWNSAFNEHSGVRGMKYKQTIVKRTGLDLSPVKHMWGDVYGTPEVVGGWFLYRGNDPAKAPLLSPRGCRTSVFLTIFFLWKFTWLKNKAISRLQPRLC